MLWLAASGWGAARATSVSAAGSSPPGAGERFSLFAGRDVVADEAWSGAMPRMQYLNTDGTDREIILPALGADAGLEGERFVLRIDATRGGSLTFRSAAGSPVATSRGAGEHAVRWLQLLAQGGGWVASDSSGASYGSDSAVFTYLGANPAAVGRTPFEAMFVAPASPRADGWSIRFRTDAPRFLLSGRANNPSFRVRVDGEVRYTVEAGPDGGEWMNYLVELGTTQPREIEILADRLQFWGVMLPDDRHAVEATRTRVPATRVVAISDSVGLGGTRSVFWSMGEVMGLEVFNRPWAATGYLADGGGRGGSFIERSAEDVASALPDILIVSGGTDEIGRGYPAGSFRAAVEELFDYYNDILPEARKVALSPFWKETTRPAEVLEKTAIIREVTETRGFTFVDWNAWVAGMEAPGSWSGNLAADERRLTAIGMAYLGGRLARELTVNAQVAAPPLTAALAAVTSGPTSAKEGTDLDGKSKAQPVTVAATDASSLTGNDIGSPAVSGSWNYNTSADSHTVRAGGSDIWGSSDQFHFVHQAVSGDAEMVARVGSLANTDSWAKAGLMLRSSTGSSEAHVSIFVTPNNGVRMQWRSGAGGESFSTGHLSGSAPHFVRLVRSGSTFTAYRSGDGSAWEQVHSLALSLPQELRGGLALTSHNTGAATTAEFTNFTINGSGGAPSAGAPSSPALALTAADIGSPALGGSTQSGGTGAYTVTAAGADVWNAADQFHYAYQAVSGDADMVVRVDSLGATDIWAKAGLMFRASASPGSAHVSVFVTPSNGVRLQWRSVAGGASETGGFSGGPAPRFLRLARAGNSFSAYHSTDGSSWSPAGSVSVSMGQPILAGLAVTSHNAGARTTAAFSGFAVQATQADPPPASSGGGGGGSGGTLEGVGLTSQDLGSVGLGGSATENGGTVTIRAAGADIWNNADSFHFAWKTLSGDGTATVRVSGLANTHAWAKAGLMMRESLETGARHALVAVTAGNGTAFQRRQNTSGESTHSGGPGLGAPAWVRLVRSGNTFTALVSTDGNSWSTIGSDNIAMGQTVRVGLAVTSHDTGALTTASFTDFSLANTVIGGGESAPPPASGPSEPAPGGNGAVATDIGGPTPATVAGYDAASHTHTIQAGGADIWGRSDQFHFLHRQVDGDAELTVLVKSLSPTDGWAKAGLMLRASSDAGAAHASVFVTPANGVRMQWRDSNGGESVTNDITGGSAPHWLRLVRSGNTFTAYRSYDGLIWNRLHSVQLSLPSSVRGGLAVCAHNAGARTTAVCSNLSIVAGVATGGSPLTYYVANYGSDSNSGESWAPFATPARARDAVRAATGRSRMGGSPQGQWGGANIVIKGGTYWLSEALQLDTRDSGTASHPLVFRAENGENAVISGAYRVPDSAWRLIGSESDDSFAWSRLPASARGRVYRLDVAALGISKGSITASTASASSRLAPIVGGRKREMARWPNGPILSTSGWTRIESVAWDGGTSGSSGIVVADGAPRTWNLTDQHLLAFGHWAHDWMSSWENVQSVSDAGGGRSLFTIGAHEFTEPIGGDAQRNIFFANLLQHLDQAGSFVWNHGRGMLYYLPDTGAGPPSGASLTSLPVVIQNGSIDSRAAPSAANWIGFSGLTIEGARDRNISSERSIGVFVENCDVRNATGQGVWFRFGEQNKVIGGRVSDVTSSGVTMIGAGEIGSYSDSGCVIDGVTIERCGWFAQLSSPGIQLNFNWNTASSSGVTVRNNTLRDLPGVGLGFTAARILVENNVFERVVRIDGDVGAAYAGGKMTYRGNVVRGNTFRDIVRHPGLGRSWGGVAGLYIDDSFSGVTIENNTFTNCDHGLFLMSGKDNIVRDNTFTDCHYGHFGAAIYLGSRVGWGHEKIDYDLATMPVDQQPWISLFPDLVKMRPGGSLYSTRMRPTGNVIEWNRSTNGTFLFKVHPSVMGDFNSSSINYAVGTGGATAPMSALWAVE